MAEEKKNSLVINIRIGNQPFPIEIPYEREEAFRAGEKLVNTDLAQFQSRYPDQSMERYMAMALLDLGVKLFLSEQSNDTAPFVEALNELSAEIKEAFPEK